MTDWAKGQIYGAEPGTVDTPDWVADAVFYQIFPDRFAISPSLEKPGNLEPWDSDPTTYGYKGGDLVGVRERLDYIQDLGANALYLNPIFQSASNHRYHTHDYLKVDPMLGGDQALFDLIDECHRRGMRIILDGVFNHASRGFFQFNDVLENGAASAWVDWFTFHEHPANAYDHKKPAGYLAWWGLHALPKLNTDNPQVREYIMRVGEYWLRAGIDGWRLDVPDEIRTEGFWEEFRSRMRAINPECYIVGEIWEISTDYLAGTRFDALMNYVFTSAALAFCGRDRVVKKWQDDRAYDPWPGIDGLTYAQKINTLLGSYDWNVQLAQMTLLGSHDTPRVLTLLGDDLRSVELAYFLMFTFPGAPNIYYGDEIAIDGGLPDKWARKTFPWDHEDRWNRDLRNVVQRLIGVRREHAALRHGSYGTVAASEACYAFVREFGDEVILGVLNTSDSVSTLELPHALTGDVLISIGEVAHQDGTSVTLPPRSASLWRVTRGS